MNGKQTLTKQQKEFLTVFNQVGGNISMACRKANIKSRTTYYRWLENDEFRDAVENVNESFIDLAESQLRAAVSRGDMNAVFFLLKTKGKNRGYVERTEQSVSVNDFQKLMQELDDE
nr:MAG TPA: putative terminase small subunit [Caudoviricetes sp.]